MILRIDDVIMGRQEKQMIRSGAAGMGGGMGGMGMDGM